MSRIDKPETQADDLKSKVTEVGDNLRDLGGQVRSTAKEQYSKMSDAAHEQYDRLAGQAHEYYDQGRKMAQDWEQGIESYVREKPVKALLMAAGVGVLLGVLWRRD